MIVACTPLPKRKPRTNLTGSWGANRVATRKRKTQMIIDRKRFRAQAPSPMHPLATSAVALSSFLIVALALTGCASKDPAPKGTEVAIAPASPPSADASPPDVLSQPTCEGRAAQPRDKTWSVEVGKTTRTFAVHVPPSYDPRKAAPLVLNFHGYNMSGALEEWLTFMGKKADAEGFVLVYPEGTGNPLSFNAGACCGDAMKQGVDDVAFTTKILDSLEAELCIDAKRVYAAGMSNGGFMSHRLGCEMSSRIAAIAPVAGVNGTADCKPTRPVSVLHFHGTDDPTIPYEGKASSGWPSARDTVKSWADRDGCTGDPVETFAKDDVRCLTYKTCREGAEVTLCTVDKGGHTWPGGSIVPPEVKQGSTTQTISANDAMWEFFKKHPMP